MAQYPRITPPGVSVTINYPGASAPVVADTVAALIEQQVNGVEGMLYMSSQMGNDGSYTLTVTFDIGTDVNTALVMVQNRVALAMPQLPTAGPEPGDHDPQEDARHVDDRQLLLAGRPVRRHLPEQLRHDLRQGRAAAGLRGLGHQLHGPARLQHPRLARPAEAGVAEHDRHGCGQRDSQRERRRARRADRPVARPRRGQPFQLPVDTLGRLSDPEQFGSIVVKAGQQHRRGAGDRHRPPARRGPRRDGRSELQPVLHLRRPPVGGPLHLPASRNQCARRRRPVRAKMEELKTRFPDGVDYDIAYDTTPYIRESVGEVFKTLRDAVILVGLVVLVFLQDWRAMILPMIDVPVSLIGTFAVMAALGFSLNNLTLFGLVLAIGIVVDDAIVVLENIERMIARATTRGRPRSRRWRRSPGRSWPSRSRSARCSCRAASSGGITGQFFRQFAVTIAVSTIISAVNALTMTPSRAVLIFKTEEGSHGHEFKREALPWWIFGVVGGVLAVLVRAQSTWPGGLACRPFPAGPARPKLPAGCPGRSPPLYFAPGAVVGGAIGWLIIRPVNAVLGWLFRGFNRLFDVVTVGYGWTVGKLLRVSVARACWSTAACWC